MKLSITAIARRHAQYLNERNALRHGDARLDNPVYHACNRQIRTSRRHVVTMRICGGLSMLCALLGVAIDHSKTTVPDITANFAAAATLIMNARPKGLYLGIAREYKAEIDRSYRNLQPSGLLASSQQILLLFCTVAMAIITPGLLFVIFTSPWITPHDLFEIAIDVFLFMAITAQILSGGILFYTAYLSIFITGTPARSRQNKHLPAGETAGAR